MACSILSSFQLDVDREFPPIEGMLQPGLTAASLLGKFSYFFVTRTKVYSAMFLFRVLEKTLQEFWWCIRGQIDTIFHGLIVSDCNACTWKLAI